MEKEHGKEIHFCVELLSGHLFSHNSFYYKKDDTTEMSDTALVFHALKQTEGLTMDHEVSSTITGVNQLIGGMFRKPVENIDPRFGLEKIIDPLKALSEDIRKNILSVSLDYYGPRYQGNKDTQYKAEKEEVQGLLAA